MAPLTRHGWRTRLSIALCALITGAAVSACAGAAAAGGGPRKPQLSDHQVLQIALDFARRAGDPNPTLIQHSTGTRRAVNLVSSGGIVPGAAWSYLIAERGNFVLNDVPIPPGAHAPSGSVLTLVVDAKTGQITDRGVSDRYPDLSKLGQPVVTDRRSDPASAVPKVTGLSLPAGYARLHAAGLRVSYDGALQLGTEGNFGCNPVISSQRPAPGGAVGTDRVVTLTGSARCALGSPALPTGKLPSWIVPTFVGKPLPLAVRWARKHDLYWSAGRLPKLRDAGAKTLLGNYRVKHQRPHPGSRLKIAIGARHGNSGTIRLTPLRVRVVLEHGG